MENQKRKGISGYIWILIILLVIWGGIELFGKDKVSQNNVPDNTTVNTTIATNTVVNITGSGNEPGWYISISGNADSANTSLIVDYADSTFTGTLGRTWQENYDSEFQFRGSLSPSATSTINSDKDFIVYFKKENCIDPAGRTHEYSVDVNMHSEKEYKGCADVN